MDNTTLELLLDLMGVTEAPKDATNSEYVGIMTENNEYKGYVYFDEDSEAEAIMAKPENEGLQLHTFKYSGTLTQKPRKVIRVERS